jgi:UDP:flavonoid glycosyltransferase YjiC (YdhE family)
VTGFSFLKLATSYIPPQDLLDFLNAGPAPIYIGFGSIVVADPKALTELILKAVQKAGVRAIISRGWGGVSAEAVPPNVHFIGNCPHDWLFEQVSVVVHHGGAGTTAAGIAAGKPTVIVPFFGDQPFWANMVWRAGAGPQPVPFKQMTADTLAQSIRTAQRPDVKNAVNQMRAKIAAEDGALQTVLNFHDKLDIDRMRCQVCPDQLAIWDVKLRRKTYQLSNRAVAVLVQEKVINASQCRL